MSAARVDGAGVGVSHPSSIGFRTDGESDERPPVGYLSNGEGEQGRCWRF